MTDLLVISGMHRSGTSLVAQLLERLGWDVGPPADLMPPKPDNPRGFTEHLPAVRLNDRLLHRLGGTWFAPPALPPGWALRTELDDLRPEAEQIIARLLARGADRLLMKDPRFSLTLPFWQTVTDVHHVLVVVRDPDAVVASLLRRSDELDEAGAATLWIRYLLTALRNDERPHLTSTAVLLSDLPVRLHQLSHDLGHVPDDRSIDEASQVVEEQLWGRSLRSRTTQASSTAALEHARLLHTAITADETMGGDATRWRSALGSLATLEEVTAASRTTWAWLDGERGRQMQIGDQVPRLRAELDRARDHIERLRGERDRARATSDALQRESAHAPGREGTTFPNGAEPARIEPGTDDPDR